MKTKIAKPTPEVLAEAGELLRRGELVAFPTETVYGLGANAFDAAACARIYQAKGRPSDNPLILHVANRKMINMAASDVSKTAEKLIALFCPGPLTLILPKQKNVPSTVTGNLPTVGIRWPANDIACAMIRAAGVPIAAPSANVSGRPSPTTASMVAHDLAGKIPLILDGGATEVGLESTIVECTDNAVTILRPGAVTKEMLTEAGAEVRYDPGLIGAEQAPKAPGMKYRHYAPQAHLTVITSAGENLPGFWHRYVERIQAAGHRVGVLADGEIVNAVADIVPEKLTFTYGAPGDTAAMAAKLYEGLSYFDSTDAEIIVAQGVKETGLGAAVMNRLKKASGGDVIEAKEEMSF